jgi:hypothetical protein
MNRYLVAYYLQSRRPVSTHCLKPTAAGPGIRHRNPILEDLIVEVNTDIPSIIGVLIPVVAIVMGIGIGMLSMWLDYRKKQDIYKLHHAERMAAIEKGVEVPPLPPEFFHSHRRGPRTPAESLRRGLVLLLLGAAVSFAIYNSGEPRHAWWGLVLVAIGAANLLFYVIQGRHGANDATDTDGQKPERRY